MHSFKNAAFRNSLAIDKIGYKVLQLEVPANQTNDKPNVGSSTDEMYPMHWSLATLASTLEAGLI